MTREPCWHAKIFKPSKFFQGTHDLLPAIIHDLCILPLARNHAFNDDCDFSRLFDEGTIFPLLVELHQRRLDVFLHLFSLALLLEFRFVPNLFAGCQFGCLSAFSGTIA